MKNVTLCYIERGDEYLMLHRVKKKNDVNQDKWIGVGGKFEDKESPEDCILRETMEETGLRLTDYRYRGLVTFVNTIYETEYMHLFTATGWEGDKIFLKLLADEEPFFSLKLSYDGDILTGAVLNGKEMAI